MKVIYIEDTEYATRAVYEMDGEIWSYNAECKGSSNKELYNVYKCKIARKINSLSAAFVDLGNSKTGYLQLSPKEFATYNVGDFVMAQVKKERFGEKDPCLDTGVTIPGRYLVYCFNGSGKINVSSRIKEDITEIIDTIKGEIRPNESFIVRTAGAKITKELILLDIKKLRQIADFMNEEYRKIGTHCGLVFEEPPLLVRLERDIIPEVDKIVTDNPLIAEKYPTKSELYTDNTMALFNRYNLVEKVEKEALPKVVEMAEGGTLVIDYTEGMTVIDVNSAKIVSNLSQEETSFMVNMRAAKQVIRQLSLRNISGIVIVDFISMNKDSNKKLLLEELERLAPLDKAKINVAGMTNLGFVELTRKRMSVRRENIVFDKCLHCDGTGLRHSPEFLSYKVVSNIRKLLEGQSTKVSFNVKMRPDLYDFVENHEMYISWLSRIFKGTKITFTKDSKVDEFVVEYQ